MSTSPTSDIEKKQKRGKIKTPPRPVVSLKYRLQSTSAQSSHIIRSVMLRCEARGENSGKSQLHPLVHTRNGSSLLRLPVTKPQNRDYNPYSVTKLGSNCKCNCIFSSISWSKTVICRYSKAIVNMSVTKQRKGGKKQLSIPSKLDEAEQAIRALKRTMDEEASVLLEERSTFEIMRKKLDGVHFKKHIKLNVGGQIFKTSIETLLKDPDSMLAAMFSERFDVKPDEEDGAYFIDRDGTHFRYILNYLRTGKLIYPKENKVLARELYLEAEFYQITGIRKEIWPGGLFQNSSYIINSLNDEQKTALLSLLPAQDIFFNWVQLYSSSNQGWSSSNFHQCCDNKGPTVIIAKAGNNIFGGYAEVSWNSGSSFAKDENAFLFTLVNPTRARPTKLVQTDGSGGIWCHPSYGPSFGSAGGACIYFMNCEGTSSCSISNNYVSFAVPEGQTFTNFIYGNTTSFGMNYLEVFGLKGC